VTNAGVIRRFIDVPIAIEREGDGAHLVTVGEGKRAIGS
jgi:hypothetical protein